MLSVIESIQELLLYFFPAINRISLQVRVMVKYNPF